MFVETVDNLVLECQRRFDTTVPIPWGWLFTQLLGLLSRYPSGVTKAILLSELEASWMKIEKLQSKGGGTAAHHGTDSLRRIVVTQQLSREGILEVFLREVTVVGGTQTKLGVIAEQHVDPNHGSEGFTMQMYLHKKLYDEESMIIGHDFKLRFTGCRLFQGRGNLKSMKLLPSDNFVILVDQDSAEKLFSCFPSLEGLDHCTKSQYIKSIKIKVVEIGETESLHYPNGQTMNQIIVTVVDELGIQTKFILWEDYLLMAKLFEEGDTLYIKNCFLVPDPNECYVLEYGPETVIYCCHVGCEQQLVPSQSSGSLKPLYVSKDRKGRLDYGMYPERLTISEIKASMTNMTLFGQVIQKEPRKLARGSGVSMVTYQITVKDATGDCKVMVTDKLEGGTVVHVGQFVLMRNLSVSENISDTGFMLYLDNGRCASMWNISSLEGWLTTTCICTVTPLNAQQSQLSCVVKGTVTNVKSRTNQSAVVQTHCSCHTNLLVTAEGKVHCERCNVSGMAEMLEKTGLMLFSLDSFWQWQYNVSIIITDSAGHSIQVDLSNEAAETLLQMSARQFHALEENARQRVVECSLGQECRYGMCSYSGQYLIGVISPI